MIKITGLLCVLAALLAGCGDQKTSLEKSVYDPSDSATIHKSCPKADFHKNVLEKKNLLHILSCLGTDKNHRVIFTLLNTLDDEGFSVLLNVFNDAFFHDTGAREKFVLFLKRNLNEKKRKEVLRAAGDFISISEELNVFQSLLEGLSGNHSPLPSGEFFVKLSELRKAAPSGPQLELLDFLRSKLKNEKSEETTSLFVEMASSIINRPKAMKELAVFLEELSLVQGSSQELSEKEFYELIDFIASLDEEIYSDMTTLEANLLSRKGDCSQSLSYQIDHAVEIKSQMETLAFGTFEEFYSAFFDLNFKYSLYLNVCEQGEVNGQIERVLEAARSFLRLNGSYSLARAYLLSQNQDTGFEIFRLAGTSFCLKSGKLLARLRHDGKLRLFSNLIYDFLKRYKGKERLMLTSFLKKGAEEEEFLGFVRVFWRNLDLDQRTRFSKFMLMEVPFGENQRATAELLGALHETYPELISELSEILRRNHGRVESFIRQLEFFLSNETNRSLLTSFLTSKDFDRFFSVLSHLPAAQAVEVPVASAAPEDPFPILRSYVLQEGPIACFEKLEEAFDKTSGFWDVLPNYPQECHEVFKPTIIKNVFSWTNQIDAKFFQAFQRKFSVPYGVLSKDMMRFYLSLILIIDHHVDHSDPEYIRATVQKIKAQMFDHGLLRALEKGLEVLDFNKSSKELISSTLMYFSTMSVENFSSAFSDDSLLERQPVDWSMDNMEKIHPRLRVSGGLQAALRLNEELFELLSREEEGDRLIEALVDFVNPVEGVPQIYGMEEKKFHFDLKNMLLFLNELSDEDHVRQIYHFKNGADVEQVPMFLSERLETVIVEISFLNNFYGSYFVNKISRSQNYAEEVRSLKKFVRALDMSEGFFRRIGVYPPETQWAFKNIYNTYDSLGEIGEPSFGPTERAYDKMVQAFLSQLVTASRESSKSFSPYRKPKPEVAEGHAGKIMAVIAKEKLLTKTSLMLRNSFPSLEERLEEAAFEELNRKFTALDFNQIKKFLSFFFSSPEAKGAVEDFIHLFYSLEERDKKRFLNIGANILEAAVSLNQQQLEAGLEIVETLIRNHNEIKTILAGKIDIKHVLPWLEETSFLAPSLGEKFGDIITLAKGSVIELISDKAFHEKVDDFLKEAKLWSNGESLVEMAKIFSDHRLRIDTFHQMLKEVVEKEGDADYFTQMFSLLGAKENGRTNLYWALKELFEEKQALTVQFLEDIIARFKLIRDTQPTSSEKIKAI